MTKLEKKAFREGVEEGYVRAAELADILAGDEEQRYTMFEGDLNKEVLRQFRPISPTFRTQGN